MKILLGTKEKMTQIFDENGVVTPVTVINAGPAVITQIKTTDKDGYESIQLSFGDRKAKNINKSRKGHFKDLGDFRYTKEFRVAAEGVEVGSKIDASTFEVGDIVNLASFSKGKGFQGVVKRHDFAGGPRTHGQKHSEREGGSIGSGGAQRVFKGLRMPGRMGNDRITVKNVKIVQVNPDQNQILVKGAVPGRRGTLVEIQG